MVPGEIEMKVYRVETVVKECPDLVQELRL